MVVTNKFDYVEEEHIVGNDGTTRQKDLGSLPLTP